MATREELYTALQKADAAGDTEAAKAIAKMYAGQASAPEQPADISGPSPLPNSPLSPVKPRLPPEYAGYQSLMKSPQELANMGTSRNSIMSLPIAALPGGRLAQGAYGAAAGAIDAAQQTPQGEDWVGPAVRGGAAGGATALAVGAAAPYVAKAGQAVGRAVTRKVPATEQAQQKLLRAFGKDRIDPQNAVQALEQFPQTPLSLMDVGGSNVQRLGRSVVTQPGAASEDISRFLGERQSGQSGRVLDAVKQNLANGSDVHAVAQQLMEQRAATAKPLYEEAFGTNENISSPAIDEILATPAGKSALAQARVKMRNDRSQMGAAELPGAAAPAKAGATVNLGGGGKGETLFDAIRRHGGIRINSAQGYITREGGEVREALKDVKSRGLINDKEGMTPDYMREALQQEGWFGRTATSGQDIDEFYQALRSGKDFRHPEASAGSSAAAANAGNLDEARTLADEMGLSYGKNWSADDIYKAADDLERGAVSTGGEAPGRNLRTLDYVKRSLDDQIGVAVRAGAKDDVRILNNLKKDFVRALDKADQSGAYSKARAAYSGPTQSAEAIENGQAFLKLSPEELKTAIGTLSESDQDFFRVGAARALQDRISSAADSADDVKRVFGNARIRSQIDAVFGKGKSAEFAQAMTGENLATGTNRAVLGNSNTAAKLAEMSEGYGGRDAAQDAAKGFLIGGFKGAAALPALNYGKGKIAQFFNPMKPDVASSLAEMLTRTGPGVRGATQAPPPKASILAQILKAQPAGPSSVGGISSLALSRLLANPVNNSR